MNLAISNIAWSAEQDDMAYKMMRELGFSGLEIAPTRIFPENPYNHIEEAEEWRKQIGKQYGFEVPSMQSIWYGRPERMFGTDKEREQLLIYTKQAIDFASVVGCKNLVFGCPKNRCLPERVDAALAVPFFSELAEYAVSKGTVIGLEANPPIYHTNYINTTDEAFMLIERVSSAGFALNLDVGTMLWNHEIAEVLKGRVQHISHVHVSEPYLAPVMRRGIHHEIADILNKEGYQGFVSIEMGRQQDLMLTKAAMQEVQRVFG